MGAAFIGTDVAKRRADKFARTQTGRVGKVEQEAQPMRGGGFPG